MLAWIIILFISSSNFALNLWKQPYWAYKRKIHNPCIKQNIIIFSVTFFNALWFSLFIHTHTSYCLRRKKTYCNANMIMTATVLNYDVLVRKAYMIWGSSTEHTALRGFQFLPASLTSSVFTSQTTFASSSGTLCPADSRLSEGTSTHNSQHNMHIQPCNVLQKRNNKNKCIAYYTKYLDLPWKKISLYYIQRHFI